LTRVVNKNVAKNSVGLPCRKGKVQLIDASEMYIKRRKNLGEKNCDLSDPHIDTITTLHMSFANEGVSKVFDNADFGYYKVTVERPLRKKAQFTPDRVATLRFTSGLQDVMGGVYSKYGDEVYTRLKDHNQAIQDYLERQDITLSPKNHKALLNPKTWQAQKDLMDEAKRLMASIGQDLFDDFNLFKARVDADLTACKVKLTVSQKNQILNAVSWRDENAAKVIKKVHKLTGSRLDDLLAKLDCTEDELPDHGYWPTGNKGEYIEYEADSDLRDSENVSLKDDIHAYFLREVRPHVDDAWFDISSVKIGYEISFNRYFYRHKPLRSLNEVTQEIMELEKETEGLVKQLINLTGEGGA
ncbi:MAG: SAM-dependent DNA methyltransferase, partial [Aestuariivita sp.]|nr:SAM-dependent DNA methyltransferase [Aestuariivita sp.]